MDFIDFETLLGDQQELPQPQPALSLPISTNIGKRFSSFSLTRNLLSSDGKADVIKGTSKDSQLAEKYAKLSISEIEKEIEGADTKEGHAVSVTPETDIKTSSLSTRLSRVLNNQLSDSTIRDVFTNLEDKFPEQKINESNRLKELIEPGVAGSMSRKKLRGRIENELIKNQNLVLKEYQPVIKHLKSLEERLQKLNKVTANAGEKINRNHELSSDFNSQVNELTKEKKLIALKKNLLASFKAKFTLNEYEEFVLNSGDINDEFFIVLKKAESINENCSILLSIDNPQLGLKIMNKINQLINKAVERILTFTNKTLNNLYSLNSKARLVTLHQCLRYLKNKLNYLNSVITKFAESRSKTLVEDFLNQVQGDLETGGRRGSISGDARPVFVSAHDPTRYVGDLLAHVHSIVVNELETITSIFTIENLDAKEKSEFQNIINEIVEKILKALSRPIKSKIEQLISGETKLPTIYSIFNLVELYTIILSKQLSEKSDLLITINQLVKTSQNKIITIIKNRLATFKTSNLAQLELSLDLQPPEWIIEFYSDILPLVDQITTDTILNLPQKEHEAFMSLTINEPIEILDEHIKNNKLFSEKRDRTILKINFLDLILSKVMPITLLSDKAIEVNELIVELTQELTEIQLDTLLKESDLYDYFNIVHMICPFTDDFFEVSIYEPITENKLFVEEEIQAKNTAIENFLPNALLEIQQSLLKLNSPSIVSDVIVNSSLQYVKFYYKFNQIVNEYLKVGFTWTDVEVATLLGVDEPYIENKQLIEQNDE